MIAHQFLALYFGCGIANIVSEKNTNAFSFDGISVTVTKNPYQRKNSQCNFQNYHLISLEYVEMFRKLDILI